MKKLLVVDNYDSFTHNLVQLFMRHPLDIPVFRNDRITPAEALALAPDYLLISPGPRDPAHAGVSKPLLRLLFGRIPILGVCLGMQCLNEVMGGRTVAAPAPVHGKTSAVYHTRRGIFQGIPSPFQAARYHSLMIEPGCSPLCVDAETADHVIMGISHAHLPVFGLQFHPESFMTEWGEAIIENFLSFGPALNEAGAFGGRDAGPA